MPAVLVPFFIVTGRKESPSPGGCGNVYAEIQLPLCEAIFFLYVLERWDLRSWVGVAGGWPWLQVSHLQTIMVGFNANLPQIRTT